jgi:hypothetical protein
LNGTPAWAPCPPVIPEEFLALELPPDGSVWVVDSPHDPDDLEGREVEVKIPDGTAKRW